MIKFFIILISVNLSLQFCKVDNVMQYDRNEDHNYATSEPNKWYLKTVTWCLFYDRRIMSNNSVFSDMEKDLQRAFSEWSYYIDLNFQRISCLAGQRANINLGMKYRGEQFLNARIELNETSVLAIGYYPHDRRETNIQITTLFVADVNWEFDIEKLIKSNVVNNTNNYIFYNIALHEIGHNLGIRHIEGKCNVMHRFYNGVVNLQPGDISKALELYDASNHSSVLGLEHYLERKKIYRPRTNVYRKIPVSKIYPTKKLYPTKGYPPNTGYPPNIYPPRIYPPNTGYPTNTIYPPRIYPYTTHYPIDVNFYNKQYEVLNNNNLEYFMDEKNKSLEVMSNYQIDSKEVEPKLFYIYRISGLNLKHPFILNKDNKDFYSFIN